jgi:hypothetical protein
MMKALAIWMGLFVAVAGGAGVGCATGGDEPIEADEAELGNACALVRCFAAPDCAEGQHVVYTPNDCCGTCVGPDEWTTDRCALVLCLAVECPAGEQRIYSPGQCCGVCVPKP